MYIPISCLTHGSPLFSQTTPQGLVDFCTKKGYKTAGLADFDNLFMCVQYYEACEQAGIKPMLGVQIAIHGDDEESYVNVYAKNLRGWQQLLNIIYEANNPEEFEFKPRLEVFYFIQMLSDDLLVVIRDKFVDIFQHHNNGNIYVGLDPISYPKEIERLRQSSLPKVAISPNHYLKRSDWGNNKYLLASHFKSPISKCSDKHKVFASNSHFILSEKDLLRAGITEEEINATEEIYNRIDSFNILNPQKLPHFPCPDDLSQDDYLRQLCRIMYKKLQIPNTDEYINRIKMELDVFSSADMAGYFLVVQDIVRWAKENGILVGYGRGSAAGCIVSYLLGIVDVDPIQYNLLFERFYSADRKGLPDIDLDFPPSRREEIVNYIAQKYGEANIAQLTTFITLKGAAGLKAVLRGKGLDAQEQNFISSHIPQEGKIAPELHQQKEELGSESLLLWCINNIDDFGQWCTPKYDGVYSTEFKAAIELDKIISGRGKHASAFALSNEPIYKKAPLIWDAKANRHVVGVNMDDAEKLGLIKLDLLGVDVLDKADFIRKGLKNGYF